MEGNTMSTEEVEKIHTEGPRWEIVRRYETYTDADMYRNGLLTETDSLQVKIHRMGPEGDEFFAVKTRVDPGIAKREEKKKRKARLSKKRRKK
jgi:hypothetical protein